MTDQEKNISQLKKSLKDFIHQINYLLTLCKKRDSQITKKELGDTVRIIDAIEKEANELDSAKINEELHFNIKLVKGFIQQEFYINASNTQKTSLIALKILDKQKDPLKDFKQMLLYWTNEKAIIQVLINDLYNIIDELAA